MNHGNVFFFSEVTCQFSFSAFIYVKSMWSFHSYMLQQHLICFRGAVTRGLSCVRKINCAAFLTVTGRLYVRVVCLCNILCWKCGCNSHRAGAWKYSALELQEKLFATLILSPFLFIKKKKALFSSSFHF